MRENLQPMNPTQSILVVDDEPALREFTRQLLELFHYRVLEAASAAEALEVWSRHSEEIALVLTDMSMPGGMSGQALIQRLQALKPGLGFILMSGSSGDEVVEDFLRKTRATFLQKPCPSAALVRAVRNCLVAEPTCPDRRELAPH